MNPISVETFSNLFRDNLIGQREYKVMRFLHQLGSATVWEIVKEMGEEDPNYVRPRVTELVQKGYVIEIGKKFNDETKEENTIYSVVKDVHNPKPVIKTVHSHKEMLQFERKLHKMADTANSFQIKKWVGILQSKLIVKGE